MAQFWKQVNYVIWGADVLLMLLDARLVTETRNREIEDKIKKMKKPLIYVITKCDLVNKEDIEKQKNRFSPCVFISAKEHLGTTLLRKAILTEAQRIGIRNRLVRVGVLGYPNVGKSSLINAMKGRKSAPTSILSGYTKSIRNVRADNRILFIDTPGVIPFNENAPIKHALIGTVDFTKAKDIDMIAMEIMKRFPGKIEKFYKVTVQEDKEQTIEDIAIARKILIKGGKADIPRTSTMILKDWQGGNIK